MFEWNRSDAGAQAQGQSATFRIAPWPKSFPDAHGVGVLQYWKSFEHLHAYAHAKDAKELPAWAEFNRRVAGDGSVGIWHET